MPTYCAHTLVDITENGVLFNKFPFKTKGGEVIHDKESFYVAKNQQANFTTLVQTLQLRSNIVWEVPPIRQHDNIVNMKFGDAYEGKHYVWNFIWQVEATDLYSNEQDKYGMLHDDFDMIPILNFCKETATFPNSAFITKDTKFKNTYFSFIPEQNK